MENKKTHPKKDLPSSESESNSDSEDTDKKMKRKSRRHASSLRDEWFDKDRKAKGKRDYMSKNERTERKR